MHISVMKALGINMENEEDETLSFLLDKICSKTEHISKQDTYYYLPFSFYDIPGETREDKNEHINNNEWFVKSTITSKLVQDIILELDEVDYITDKPVRDFLQLLQEVDLEFLEIRIFEI